jgi:site-specific DNA-cytosine methylase
VDPSSPTLISFCTGYAGLEIGIERALGRPCRVLAYSEIEAFAIENLAAKVQAGFLPAAPVWSDLRSFPGKAFHGMVDILCGGYPCPPFSTAGKRLGKADPRHLWPFFRNQIRAIRPRFVFCENVEGHVSLGLSTVLSDLEEDGYQTAWGIYSAEEVGAPHRRKRVFILGYDRSDGGGGSPSPQCTGRGSRLEDQAGAAWATPNVPNGGRSVAHVTDWRGGTAYHNGKKVQIQLENQVRNWPVVTVMDASGMGPEPRPSRAATNRKTEYLARMVQWPTPTAPRPHDTETTAGQYFPSQNQKDLVWAACMWPTPAARDYRSPYAETGLIRKDGKPRLDLLPDAVRYEVLFCRKATQRGSGPSSPHGPPGPENPSGGGNPQEQRPTPRAYSFAASHLPGLTPLDIKVRGLYPDNPRYWASPHANCTTGAGNQGRQGGENLQTQAKGKLNPRWVETLMGLPVGWTMPSCASPVTVVLMSCACSATASSPPPQNGPSGSSTPNSGGAT